MPGVFTWRPGTDYEDRIESEYRFRSRHDGQMKEVGLGWVVIHRSRRGDGSAPSAYIGVGEVYSVEQLTVPIGMRVARIRNFLAFEPQVPFRDGSENREEALRKLPNIAVGPHTQGNPIRPLSNEDFGAIVRAGLADLFDPRKTALLDLDDPELIRDGADLLNLPFDQQIRRMQEILMKRPIREAAFRRDVRSAYDFKCAFTGLSIRNGGGRPEVDGAHIWEVKDGGPDVVQNGIALSKTAHWMFDRGLIRVNDDYSLQISDNKVPAEFKRLVEPYRKRIHLPKDKSLSPHKFYLQKHRDKHMAGSL
ncbi:MULTISPECIES: HNH endonuclease [Aurantimonas]|uniref:HNH nuclease domain-containing protein n=1 Tax=Aurantimonas coralicida TaxID=182270 RepID=A0A0P0Z0K7_9HYPH|nr:HNH endonuclease [Aurantimonas coralicida]BAT27152.1 hypothetical protein [Aurantimonas coralicida]